MSEPAKHPWALVTRPGEPDAFAAPYWRLASAMHVADCRAASGIRAIVTHWPLAEEFRFYPSEWVSSSPFCLYEGQS